MSISSGTGSKPSPPNGLQRTIRFIDKIIPLKTPCALKQSIEYSAQVGLNRQRLPNQGLTSAL
jgi:hypothetical protein